MAQLDQIQDEGEFDGKDTSIEVTDELTETNEWSTDTFINLDCEDLDLSTMLSASQNVQSQTPGP
jgi:hypothetical protein